MFGVPQTKRLKTNHVAMECMVTTRSRHLQSVVGAVPDELWIKILGYLNTVDISMVGATCRRLNKLSQDPSLWRKLKFDTANIVANLWAVECVIDRAVKATEMRLTNKKNKEIDGMILALLIVKAKETLKVLVLSPEIKLGCEAVGKFGCLSKLEVLDFSFEKICIMGVKVIATLKGLRELKIPSFLTTKRDSEFRYLFNELKNLVKVDMRSVSITSGTFTTLTRNNSNLETLNLNIKDSHNISLGDLVQKCPNLKSLNIGIRRMSDEGINDLVHAKKLQCLELSWLSQLTDRTLQNIAKNCVQLRELNLICCEGVKDEGIRAIAQNCPNLERLFLWGCDALTQKVIEELVMACKKLTGLLLPKFVGIETKHFKKKLRKNRPKLAVI